MKINLTKDQLKEILYKIIKERAVSIAQQRAAGAAYATRKGEYTSTKLKKGSKKMFQDYTTAQLQDLARTPHKGLPYRKRGK